MSWLTFSLLILESWWAGKALRICPSLSLLLAGVRHNATTPRFLSQALGIQTQSHILAQQALCLPTTHL